MEQLELNISKHGSDSSTEELVKLSITIPRKDFNKLLALPDLFYWKFLPRQTKNPQKMWAFAIAQGVLDNIKLKDRLDKQNK